MTEHQSDVNVNISDNITNKTSTVHDDYEKQKQDKEVELRFTEIQYQKSVLFKKWSSGVIDKFGKTIHFVINFSNLNTLITKNYSYYNKEAKSEMSKIRNPK